MNMSKNKKTKNERSTNAVMNRASDNAQGESELLEPGSSAQTGEHSTEQGVQEVLPEPAEKTKEQDPEELKKKKKSLYLYTGAILVIALGLILFSYIGQLRINSSLESEKEKSMNEARSITQRYNTLLSDYDALKSLYEESQQNLQETREELEALSRQKDSLSTVTNEKVDKIAVLEQQLEDTEAMQSAYEMQAKLSMTYRKTSSPYKSCREIIGEMEDLGYHELLNGEIRAEYNYIKSRVK